MAANTKSGIFGRLLSRVRETALMGSMLDVLEEQTRVRGHSVITDVHLLLHLLAAQDVRDALRGAGCDVVKMHKDAEQFVTATSSIYRARKEVRPRPTQHVLGVLEQAELRTLHARGVGFPVQVLLGVLSHPSPATSFAADQGTTALRVMLHLAHGHLGPNGGQTPPSEDGAPEERVADIIMLNDEFTSMDFVVHVLEGLLGMKPPDAERATLQIHQDGHASCGTLFLEEARSKVALLNEYARRHGMPLRCVLAQPG